MELYYSDASPYARKIRVLLREYKLDKVTEVRVDTKDNNPAFLAANPLGKVPALTIEHGDILFDSQLIAKYLDQEYNGGAWLPQELKDELALTAIQGMLDQSIVMIMEKRRPQEKLFDFWIDRYRVAIPRGMRWILDHYPQIIDHRVNHISISLACLLDYLSFRHPELSWQKEFTELQDWLVEFTKRSSFVETKPQ